MRHPLLLLPRPLDEFVLGDHARALIDAGAGAGALPGAIPYGALVRAPAALRGGLAASIGRNLARHIPADWPPQDTVLVAYHAIQWPVAKAMLDRGLASDLWYCRWDRYEAAHDAGKPHQLLGAWHEAMAERATLTFAVSGKLAAIEEEAGREAIVVGLSADAFPDGPILPGGDGAALVAAAIEGRVLPQATGVAEALGQPVSVVTNDDHPDVDIARGDGSTVSAAAGPIAVSLGHLGRRTDWAWLRAALERMEDLELLLIGAWHDDEVGHDPDYRWLRAAPQVVWLGPLDDREAAAVIAEADVGLVPFTVDPFNDAGLPTRILKYARLGRPTISPLLEGARTWDRATIFVDGAGALASALRQHAGHRFAPDLDLRAWALEQTAAKMNAPLHKRLRD